MKNKPTWKYTETYYPNVLSFIWRVLIKGIKWMKNKES